ncbi:MAG: alanine--glyoxylate aminotransferase family protein [Mariprofundaceae bacterium]|nr:alanine--glyoxylate aminotransferase family protein [Mariprofundaceae bacterium]
MLNLIWIAPDYFVFWSDKPLKQYLLSPGPTAVPERVLLRMAAPMIHHRTPQFSAIFAETKAMLEQVYKTSNDALMLSSSGSGAMEAAVMNLCSPGETMIYVNAGKFGERWGKIAAKHGIITVEIKVAWGEAVALADVQAALEAHPEAKALFVQASETSTTTEQPIQAIAALTKDLNTVTVVDAITALGVIDMPMDDWGLDVVISGSQKALMLPPGLATIALSDKAWAMVEASKGCNTFYFDLLTERKNQKKGKDTTAWTPAASLIIGLNEVLKMMLEEGLDNLYARHKVLAAAARAGFQALGMKLVSSSPATSATGAFVPDGVDGAAFVKYLRDEMGVTFAGGQDDLKGKIIRVAHLGYTDVFDVCTTMSAVEIALFKFGHPVQMGAGVAAAQTVLAARFANVV